MTITASQPTRNGSSPADAGSEQDWVSPNGTIGRYHSPDGKTVDVWREELRDRLLPCAYVHLYNGSDVAGFGISRDREHGGWHLFTVASVADHRRGPFPNAAVEGTEMLGWVDWQSRAAKRAYSTEDAAAEAGRETAGRYTKDAAGRRYRRAMGIGKDEKVSVPYLGVVEPWEADGS